MKKYLVGNNISIEKLNCILDIEGTLFGKMSTVLYISKAEVFVFDIPLFKKFIDIFIVKLHRSMLAKVRHNHFETQVPISGGITTS